VTAARRRLSDERGLTLVEVLVVVLITGIVITIAGASAVNALRFEREQTAHVSALNQAKIATERLTRDLRGADPLFVAEDNRIRYQVRRPGGMTTVEYRLDGDNLVVDDGTERVVLRGVVLPPGQPLFSYFNLAREQLPLPEEGPDIPNVEVRSVTVMLQVPYGERGQTVQLETNIMLRNAER
jgi:prepilin-type N-terminal cleavage/methylation domain-containing protein